MKFLRRTNTVLSNSIQSSGQHVRPKLSFVLLQTLVYVLAGYVSVVVVITLYLEHLVSGGPADIVLLVLVPLLAFVKPFAIFALILAALLLIRFRSRSALITFVICVVMTFVPMAYYYRQIQNGGQLTTNQAVSAIEDCTVESIIKAPDSTVYMVIQKGSNSTAVEKDDKTADAGGYVQYIEAAKKANAACVQHKGLEQIVYTNKVPTEPNDPSWPGNYWTTKEDAMAKIQTCSFDHVQTFNAGYQQAYAKGAIKQIPGVVGSYAIVEPSSGAFTHGSIVIFGDNNPDMGQFIQLTQGLQARCGKV